MPKVQVKVYIDERIMGELRDYIKQVYSHSDYGALSTEFQNAMAEYLRLKHTQIHTQTLNPQTPVVHKVCQSIIHKLKEAGLLNQASTSMLERVIGEVRGTDRRTITKWMRLLQRNGYIKTLGTFTWEIL